MKKISTKNEKAKVAIPPERTKPIKGTRRFENFKTEQLAAHHLIEIQRSQKEIAKQQHAAKEESKGVKTQPSFVGDYVVGRLLQQGTLGTFYEGSSRSSSDRVYIKLTEKSNPVFELLQKELKTLRYLTPHAHIARIIKVQEKGQDSIEIVEQRATGCDVTSFIAQTASFSERDAAVVTKQLLQALAFLHSRGIAHRGIKPETVWIRPLPSTTTSSSRPQSSAAGLFRALGMKSKSSTQHQPDSSSPPPLSLHVVVLDSVLASVKFASRLGRDAALHSDPEFLAPELLQSRDPASPPLLSAPPPGRRVAVGAEDVYAAGVLLATMMSGMPPHFDDDPKMVTELIAAGLEVDVGELGLPEHAAVAVQTMTELSAAKRATATACLSLPFVSKGEGMGRAGLGVQKVLADYIRRRKARRATIRLARLHAHHALLAARAQQERARIHAQKNFRAPSRGVVRVKGESEGGPDSDSDGVVFYGAPPALAKVVTGQDTPPSPRGADDDEAEDSEAAGDDGKAKRWHASGSDSDPDSEARRGEEDEEGGPPNSPTGKHVKGQGVGRGGMKPVRPLERKPSL